MAASVGVLKNTILLGQVIPSTLTKAVKVQVPYFVYDDILGAYFKKTKDFVAEDSLKVCYKLFRVFLQSSHFRIVRLGTSWSSQN